MKRFVFDVLRATIIYELVTFGGLTLFLAFAPLIGYLPYSDRPGPGWFGRFPALGWSEFWANFLQMASFGTFFAVIALQLAIPCCLLVVATHRLVKWRTLVLVIGVVLCTALTFYLMPGLGWYVALGAPAMWVAVAFSAVAGYLSVPRRVEVPAVGA